MKHRSKHIYNAVGFTLLELILVMLILCTVLGMAGPSLKGFFAMRQLEDTAARIISLTQYAQSQAVCEGRTYRLNIDLTDRTYWLTVQEQGAFRELKTNLGRVFMLPNELQMQVSNLLADGMVRYAQFDPSGQMTPGSILLAGPKGDKLYITCRTATESYCVLDEKEAYAAQL